LLDARLALASHYKKCDPQITAEDIILTSGCSQALDFAIESLCSPGSSILLPAPGFPLYQTICMHLGVNMKFYPLLPNEGWNADFFELEKLVDSSTRAILICNPSNPCGSVYSKEHLLSLISFAEKYKLVVISDEVYEEMVFAGKSYHSIASLSKTVPVLMCGGLSKRYLMPGWRVGWLVVFDRANIFKNSNLFANILNLAQIIVGPCTLMQLLIRPLLEKTPPSFLTNTMEILHRNSQVIHNRLSKVDVLNPVAPSGSMYLLVELKVERFVDIADDRVFCEKLLREQSVFLLPGSAFKISNFVRIVICAPEAVLEEACGRIEIFCKQHLRA